MAQDLWKKEQEDLHKRQLEVDAEILALEEGGGVWKQATGDVAGFEKRLRGYMRRFMQLDVQAENGAPIGDSKEDVAATVSNDLEQTTQRLESHLEYAEEKEWKLLVCCIAAELEALREARGMLLPAFGLPVPESPSSQQVLPPEEPTNEHAEAIGDPLDNEYSDPPADLLKDGDGDDHHTDTTSRSEDDEPDPAWLLES
jgi:hypothetical protein